MNNTPPTLYLIPSTLGIIEPAEVIPVGAIRIIKKLRRFVVEEEKTARRFLIKAGIGKPIESLVFYILNEHTAKNSIESFLKDSGQDDIGLLSEAGVPAVADPGTELIRLAHIKGFRIVPLVGPSSILLAVMASGLNGQNFAFSGYLPVKTNERINCLRSLEKRSQTENQSQVFIEAPYRNNQLMKAIIDTCSHETWLSIAVNLTLENELIATKTIAQWKKNIPDLHKKPAVFILQRM
ncbi:MAG: SAM-dependent methyltransferase [Bacteroidales bacterium]|nr:SAM-dependent methyltransferase [Bacteroidales bacterium]MBN2761976.1 SAM-dependent methyltransferase [Bacteroidales bacterium]